MKPKTLFVISLFWRNIIDYIKWASSDSILVEFTAEQLAMAFPQSVSPTEIRNYISGVHFRKRVHDRLLKVFGKDNKIFLDVRVNDFIGRIWKYPRHPLHNRVNEVVEALTVRWKFREKVLLTPPGSPPLPQLKKSQKIILHPAVLCFLEDFLVENNCSPVLYTSE
jgi:hypothetical protein